MGSRVNKAVVLAAGRGSRMRQPIPGLLLSAAQEAAADSGCKALVPVPCHPFLDYGLSALAEAAISRVCVVTGPEHDRLRRHCQRRSDDRLQIEMAVQAEARGTADALLAAESFAGGDPFILLNSDNYYPPPLLRQLAGLGGPGLVTLDRSRTLAQRSGNLDERKLNGYAAVLTDSGGMLSDVIEKPSPEVWRSLPEPVLVSINAWHFCPSIFTACRRIEPSSRGEIELQSAALHSLHHSDEIYRVAVSHAAVLDLSSRADIPAVAAALAAVEIAW